MRRHKQLRQLGLHLMLHLGSLLTGALEQLFTLLARLFAQFIHLPFSFLANGHSPGS